MKTYEEMAHDVLKRRDDFLNATETSQPNANFNPHGEVVYPGVVKKRSLLQILPRIAIPCAAAVLVGVVGVNVWKNVRGSQKPNETMNFAAEGTPNSAPNNTPAADENGEVLQIALEEPESIYKGGKTEINFNEVKEWNVYHLPLLSMDDRVPIADDQINNYYGMEFDRLTRLYPEWAVSEPDGGYAYYAHDEDDGVVASHKILHTTNAIGYTRNNGGYINVAASITPTYESATVENAKPSVINGFDAMVYRYVGDYTEDWWYAADIKMGIATAQVMASNVDEEEFLEILDVYTAPDKDVDNNHTQTTEDKIVVLDSRPDFVLSNVHYELDYTDYSTTPDVIWRRCSAEELNAVYGLDFLCFDKLHPDWTKYYNELDFGVYYKTDNHAIGGDIPQNCEILEARNEVKYRISEDYSITIITRLGEIPDGDVEHSVINGYDAVIFRESPQHNIFGAVIDMDGTLICATMEMVSSKTELGEEFVDLLREYTNEAAKYVKPAYLEPIEITTFNAVDPFDDYITYEVSWDVEACWWKNTSAGIRWDISKEVEEADTCLGYLKDFFGTDKLPVDEQYKGNFMRRKDDGEFYCHFKGSAKAYSPVDGKVVGACYGSYNRGLGNAVAVEFDDGKYFIIGHLDEINVAVGDTVKAGQELGVCGNSGNVYESPATISLITMQKVD